MAERFIRPVAEALYEFDNAKFGLREYESLAWVGLEQTYNNLALFTDEERLSIEENSEKLLNSSLNDENSPCNK